MQRFSYSSWCARKCRKRSGFAQLASLRQTRIPCEQVVRVLHQHAVDFERCRQSGHLPGLQQVNTISLNKNPTKKQFSGVFGRNFLGCLVLKSRPHQRQQSNHNKQVLEPSGMKADSTGKACSGEVGGSVLSSTSFLFHPTQSCCLLQFQLTQVFRLPFDDAKTDPWLTLPLLSILTFQHILLINN